MITIVGGTYREICVSPPWDQLYGSGLRAAATCTLLSKASGRGRPSFHTWVSSGEVAEAEARAAFFDFELNRQSRGDAISFRYEHPLARPTVFPCPGDISSVSATPIVCGVGVVFGMLECDVAVNADLLVYDPQAGRNARPLKATLVRGGKTCIVANLTEATCMLNALGANSPGRSLSAEMVAMELFRQEGVEAVVVKNGVRGAVVACAAQTVLVPCYETDSVFSIGSGDVFSAVFAHQWALTGQDPVTAANDASRATALYCGRQSIPIPANFVSATKDWPPVPVRGNSGSVATVYIAGPLFSVAERWFVGETKRCFEENGLRVFSPMHDVGSLLRPDQIAEADLRGLDAADLVFAILDGLDAGTIFEVGYAAKIGKPVIAYCEHVSDEDLTMLTRTNVRVFHDFTTAVHHASWTAARI